MPPSAPPAAVLAGCSRPGAGAATSREKSRKPACFALAPFMSPAAAARKRERGPVASTESELATEAAADAAAAAILREDRRGRRGTELATTIRPRAGRQRRARPCTPWRTARHAGPTRKAIGAPAGRPGAAARSARHCKPRNAAGSRLDRAAGTACLARAAPASEAAAARAWRDVAALGNCGPRAAPRQRNATGRRALPAPDHEKHREKMAAARPRPAPLLAREQPPHRGKRGAPPTLSTRAKGSGPTALTDYRLPPWLFVVEAKNHRQFRQQLFGCTSQLCLKLALCSMATPLKPPGSQPYSRCLLQVLRASSTPARKRVQGALPCLCRKSGAVDPSSWAAASLGDDNDPGPALPHGKRGPPDPPASSPCWASTLVGSRVGLTGRTPFPPHAGGLRGVCVLSNRSLDPSLPSLGRPRVVPAAPSLCYWVSLGPSLAVCGL